MSNALKEHYVKGGKKLSECRNGYMVTVSMTIREKEDMGPVPGGDGLYASLNYVPLAIWAELSRKRNSPPASEGV